MALEIGDHVWFWNGLTSQDLNIPQAAWFPGFHGENDYLGNGKDIYNFVVHADVILRGQPQLNSGRGSFAWLNNNPGNITAPQGGGGPDYGQYPGKLNWHRFLIFPSRDTGFDAIGMLLQDPSYVNLSLADAFARYAPAKDHNDPVRYAQAVATATGVSVSTTIAELDSDQLIAVQTKIAEIEGSVPGDSFAYDAPDLPAEIISLLT